MKYKIDHTYLWEVAAKLPCPALRGTTINKSPGNALILKSVKWTFTVKIDLLIIKGGCGLGQLCWGQGIYEEEHGKRKIMEEIGMVHRLCS